MLKAKEQTNSTISKLDNLLDTTGEGEIEEEPERCPVKRTESSHLKNKMIMLSYSTKPKTKQNHSTREHTTALWLDSVNKICEELNPNR